MKCYIVGGYVRDRWISRLRSEPQARALVPADRDWVVIGATPDVMIKAGFKPVGKDFPVFLHPQTHEEYALARTERKSAPGYKGFIFHASPDVTIEEDLRRRDLTINAIAQSESGETIDPYGGLQDIRDGVLRHVSNAFPEDPVRLLRCARFAARFPYFHVAEETVRLMRRMVESGETDALTPERIFQEWTKGLMSERPDLMLDVLDITGYWARHCSDAPIDATIKAALVKVAGSGFSTSARVALLTSGCSSPEAAESFLRRHKADTASIDLAKLYRQWRDRLTADTDTETLLTILAGADAVRRPERLETLFKLRAAVLALRADRWLRALHLWRNVEIGDIVRSLPPREIGQAVLAARRTRVLAELD